MATEEATRDLDLRLADELAGHGTAVLVVSSDCAGPDRAERVAVGDLDRLIAPAAGIVPLQLLSWRLAVNRGREPGAYTIASKVTTRVSELRVALTFDAAIRIVRTARQAR